MIYLIKTDTKFTERTHANCFSKSTCPVNITFAHTQDF